MQDRYWLYQRENGHYYVEDRHTGKQESLRTQDKAAARRMVAGKNQAVEQPQMNIAMAKVYLSAKSPDLLKRTWHDVMHDMELNYHGSTLARWQNMMKCAPFQIIRNLPLVYTESSHFLAVLHHPKAGTAANKWLRIVHNRALDLGWLLSPILPRKAWPKIQTTRIVALTPEQHQKLIATEKDDEFRHYLEMLWEIGGSQTDCARLHHDNIDRPNRRITYTRKKLESKERGEAAIVIGPIIEHLLDQLPKTGYLFPTLAEQNDKVRSSRFRKRANRLGFKNISLHSYRYAWAQRAKRAGMPLREAMAHLGHGSKAIHYAYSEKAEVVTLPLEYYEAEREKKIIQFTQAQAATQPAIPVAVATNPLPLTQTS